jgi:hypothetical protein
MSRKPSPLSGDPAVSENQGADDLDVSQLRMLNDLMLVQRYMGTPRPRVGCLFEKHREASCHGTVLVLAQGS